MKAKKMKEIFLKRNEKMYFWQKPEGFILDDEYLGGTKKPISLLFVLRKNGFCIFRQF